MYNYNIKKKKRHLFHVMLTDFLEQAEILKMKMPCLIMLG